MTEQYGIFDAADPQNPDRSYSAALLMSVMAKFLRDGVVHSDGAELAVAPSVPAAMSVQVGTGAAIVQGRFYLLDAALPLAIATADPSNPRIDRVVIRLSATPGRTIHAIVLKGTPAASPVAPTLTRTAETWDLSLAQVRVEAGVTSILSAKITDERANPSLCGWAVPVWVPSSQIEIVGDLPAAGHRITGLGAPSATSDAATKGYADAEIAAKIGGFGISDVAIDADKDWDGKSITNLGGLSIVEAKNVLETTYARLTLAASDATLKTMISGSVSYSGTAGAWVSVGSALAVDQYISGTGTVRIVMSVSVSGETVSCRVLKNGAVAATGNGTYDISCVAGDVFQFQVARSWPTNVTVSETHSCVAKGTVTYNMSPAVGDGKYVPLAREITPENLVARVW